MKEYQLEAGLFKTLMHPVRLAILDILRDGEQCVCHMEAMLGLRQAYISQHLMVLREAGLVADRRDGWNMYYCVIKPEIFAVLDATNAITGKTSRHIIHAHGATECPCPKCNVGEGISSSRSLTVFSHEESSL